MRVFVRLAAGERVSEWIPKGVFFISTRKLDKVSGVLDIHGFDAMRRAGDVWDIDPYANWPMSQQEAAADIARQMEVELDPRTVLSNDFPVAYPVDENGDMAMQDVLEGIAVCNAGNWIITDEGKLLLLRLGDMCGNVRRIEPVEGHIRLGQHRIYAASGNSVPDLRRRVQQRVLAGERQVCHALQLPQHALRHGLSSPAQF